MEQASVLTRGSLPATKCFTREARFHHSENTFTSSLAEVKDQNVHVCDVPIPDAVTIAWESKDRLVDFDRAAASRTVIIDDQSDWFEIDGNAWLDKSERDEMKTGSGRFSGAGRATNAAHRNRPPRKKSRKYLLWVTHT